MTLLYRRILEGLSRLYLCICTHALPHICLSSRKRKSGNVRGAPLSVRLFEILLGGPSPDELLGILLRRYGVFLYSKLPNAGERAQSIQQFRLPPLICVSALVYDCCEQQLQPVISHRIHNYRLAVLFLRNQENPVLIHRAERAHNKRADHGRAPQELELCPGKLLKP